MTVVENCLPSWVLYSRPNYSNRPKYCGYLHGVVVSQINLKNCEIQYKNLKKSVCEVPSMDDRNFMF